MSKPRYRWWGYVKAVIKKRKIIADYLETGSYRAAARENGVSAESVKRVIDQSDGFEQKAAQKKE